MYLPDHILALIHRLEQAGYAAYAVGGCVRDACLGLTPHDYDLCTAATPDRVKEIFHDHRMFLAGEKHGTISIVTDFGVVEITTFRTECGYADNRHPDQVRFVPEVEADLARRDFTVNAMAFSPTRGFADPFGGRADLHNKVLRTVRDPEERFREDSLRILRGVRFAVRFGLTVEKATMDAMIALSPLMDNLARERVFEELCKLLPVIDAEELLTFAPVIAQVIPELKPTLGFDQHSPHHAFDVFTHIAHVVEAVPPELPLRWAALLHDVGKPATFSLDETGRGHFCGHAAVSAKLADEVLHRLKAPTALRERAVTLIGQHMTYVEPDKLHLRRRLSRLSPEVLEDLLSLQQADTCSKGILNSGEADYFPEVRGLIREIQEENACFSLKDLAVNGRDLMELGYAPGKAIGAVLARLLDLVVDEVLPNTKEALLAEAAKWKETL